MSFQIVLNQSGKPAGVAGQAREDLSTGTAVTAACVGGPFLQYEWTFVSKPIDLDVTAMAAPLLSAPAASSTSISPINVPGTYEVQLAVDSGSGLGALDTDVVRITFYAGGAGSDLITGPLASDPAELPRRWIAFAETTEHNVPDAIQPSGNTEGWAREMARWRAFFTRLYEAKSWCHGRVRVDAGGPAARTNGFNVDEVEWLSTGTVKVSFQRPMPDNKYSVIPTARGAPGGSCSVRDETTTDFIVERADAGGSLVDADFTFTVQWNPAS